MYSLLPKFTSEISYPSLLRKINWLRVSDRVEYCIAKTVFNKYSNGIAPGYIHEIFKTLQI